MAKYTLDPKAIQNLQQIEKLTEACIHNETGANVEVTIRHEILIYTESLDLVGKIRELMDQARQFLRESRYEADADMPAGVTLFYAL